VSHTAAGHVQSYCLVQSDVDIRLKLLSKLQFVNHTVDKVVS
ncbi:37904_t:CDS:1, partial [Gigaspora margarita]